MRHRFYVIGMNPNRMDIAGAMGLNLNNRIQMSFDQADKNIIPRWCADLDDAKAVAKKLAEDNPTYEFYFGEVTSGIIAAVPQTTEIAVSANGKLPVN